MECVPVEGPVTSHQRRRLREIAEDTGAGIRDEPGLRNVTVTITGTQGIVERTLPMVEELFFFPTNKVETAPLAGSSAAVLVAEAGADKLMQEFQAGYPGEAEHLRRP